LGESVTGSRNCWRLTECELFREEVQHFAVADFVTRTLKAISFSALVEVATRTLRAISFSALVEVGSATLILRRCNSSPSVFRSVAVAISTGTMSG